MEITIDIPKQTVKDLKAITGEDLDIDAIDIAIKFTIDNY